MPVLALITLPTLGALAGYELTRGYASRPAVGSALTFDRGTLRIGVPLAFTARGTTTVSLVSERHGVGGTARADRDDEQGQTPHVPSQ